MNWFVCLHYRTHPPTIYVRDSSSKCIRLSFLILINSILTVCRLVLKTHFGIVHIWWPDWRKIERPRTKNSRTRFPRKIRSKKTNNRIYFIYILWLLLFMADDNFWYTMIFSCIPSVLCDCVIFSYIELFRFCDSSGSSYFDIFFIKKIFYCVGFFVVAIIWNWLTKNKRIIAQYINTNLNEWRNKPKQIKNSSSLFSVVFICWHKVLYIFEYYDAHPHA